MSKAHLYINSKGYPVTYHSFSGGDTFRDCARKYYLQRVQGWTEKSRGAAMEFGTCVEQAVQYFHQRDENAAAAVAEFNRLWAEHSATGKGRDYKYSKTDKDWANLSLIGQELVKLYTIKYPSFPYVVKDPRNSFQVKEEFEVFPGTKLAGINFTAYIDMIAEDKATGKPVIIDEKVTGNKPVPELTMLDPQLRSYSWVKTNETTTYDLVAFVWFRKCGRSIDRGDTVTLLETAGMTAAGTDVLVVEKDNFGLFVTTNVEAVTIGLAQFKGESASVRATRRAFVEANTFHVSENLVTKQRIDFKMATISPESREDIGRSIKQDIVNISTATQRDFFPMQSGVRFPHDKCSICEMRGICSGNDALRDQLVTRKHKEELEFGTEEE